MKNPKVLYILIGIFCVVAIIAGIYAEFFVKDVDKNNIIMPSLNMDNNNDVPELTQEEIKTKFNSLFTNQFNVGNKDLSAIQKIDTTKEIVYTAYHIEEQNENYEVQIDIPVINIRGDVPVSFNNITQTTFADKASEILSNQNTSKTIYRISYTGFINGNILSLVIQSTLKEGNNPQRVIVQTYNYDMETKKRVETTELLAQKNIIQSEAQKKVNDTIKKEIAEAQTLVQSGYAVYNRDMSNQMYLLKNITTSFLGPEGDLYMIFAYGNQNYTSEMDIIWYE